MAAFRLVIKRSAVKEIEALPNKAERQRVVSRIQELAREPRPPGSVKLCGSEKYRLRQGPWRVVYEIDEDQRLIRIVKVARRDVVYRSALD